MKRMLIYSLFLTLIFVAAAGCSSSDQAESEHQADEVSEAASPQAGGGTEDAAAEEGASAEKPEYQVGSRLSEETATLNIMFPWGDFDEAFESMREKFPNITLERISGSGTLEKLQEINAEGTVPDIIAANNGFDPLMELDMLYPLDDLIQEYHFDVDMLEPSIIAGYRGMMKDNSLPGFPSYADGLVLFYNKEVFDKFGQPYPTEGMTWDEVFELAGNMTAVRDGVKYYGMDFPPGYIATAPLMQLGINLTDPDTGEVVVRSNPKVAEYLELLKKFYSIPGIYGPDESPDFSTGNAGMVIYWPGFLSWGWGDVDTQKNIDMLPVPVWKNLPPVQPTLASHAFAINKHSPNKELAFEFLIEFLQPEHQKSRAQYLWRPPVKDPEIVQLYAVGNELYEDKNKSAITAFPPAMPPERISRWDPYVDLEGKLKDFVESGMDVQVFLRQLEEEATASIKDAMAAGK